MSTYCGNCRIHYEAEDDQCPICGRGSGEGANAPECSDPEGPHDE